MPSIRSILRPLAAALIACLALRPAEASPFISELMASNDTTITDQDGDYADWLEIYNPDAIAVDLGGWHLTNKAGNLTKWTFPSFSLGPGASVVIFCSSKNYVDPSRPLATNFNLSDSGGYVGLVSSDGATVVSSYTFPAMSPDISYGITQPTLATETPRVGLLAAPTPGALNGGMTNLLLADRVSISKAPGIFAGSTTVSLTGAKGAEHIRFVLADPSAKGDAVSMPGPTSNLYTGAITISTSQLLRAAVFSSDDSQHGLPSSAMYIQLDNSTASQLSDFTSNLPIIVFDDNGFGPLPKDDTYYPGWIGAYSPNAGGICQLTQTADFFVPDSVKLHGFSSATFPKQSFDVNLTDDLGGDVAQSFLGMDSDKSWGAISSWLYDRTYVRNAVVYGLSSSMGYWAPSTRFAEMFIHSTGGPLDQSSYQGVVAISDRLKVGSKRINIYSLSSSDVSGPNLTGGYILRIDHPEADLYSWTTNQGVAVMLDVPKLNVIVPAQTNYISNYVQQMESALVADQNSGYSQHTYLNYLDRASWVDYHLLNVFVENVDAFQFSEYFTKDVNGLIKAGPVWDYDRSMGSADGRDENTQHWTPDNVPDFWNVGWWQYVAHDPDFMQAWIDRWQSLRTTTFSSPNLLSLADSMAAKVGPAAATRDGNRWLDNQSRYAGGWSGEVDHLKNWLTSRADWIDHQFVAAPAVVSDGSNVTITPARGASIAYTIDGSDPRISGGNAALQVVISADSFTLPASQSFTARSYNSALIGQYPGSPWSSLVNYVGVAGASSGQFVNISRRTGVDSGANILIGGFVCTGSPGSTQQILVRGVGPTLSQFGVSGCLAHPVLTVFDATGKIVATNTGWNTNSNATAIQAAAAAVGAFSLSSDSLDSAVLLNLSPGAYTAQVTGPGNSTGQALLEAYEIGSDSSHLVNVSSRVSVDPVSGPVITGFVVTGGSAEVLIRGSGPALTQYNVTNVLAQPVLQVFDATGKLIAANTGWSTNENADAVSRAAAAVGAFPFAAGSGDSALLISLPKGAYTMQLSGAGNTAGNALAECYLVPSL